MKKILIIFTVFLLSACGLFETPTKDVTIWQTEEKESTEEINTLQANENKKCEKFSRIRILETYGGEIFAHTCNNKNDVACNGIRVMVDPIVEKTLNINLWEYEGKIITLPNDKCFIISGFYKAVIDGVGFIPYPIIRVNYRYLSKPIDTR